MIRVAVVDDQPLVRGAVVGLLAQADDIQVVAECANGAEAVEMALAMTPDVVLMDIRMPVMDGIEATREICASDGAREVRVLILTTFEDDENVFRAMRAGAAGFIGKGSEPEDIPRAVRALHAGESLLSPLATRTLIEHYLSSPASATGAFQPRRDSLSGLTKRELEVLIVLASGLSNQEIADKLFISLPTVKTHLNRIMTKLNARDRAQLVITAYESGIVTPGVD